MKNSTFNIAVDPIKITVIVAIYNNEKTLKCCIESIINQTISELQIICIDDGSTDNSLKIAKEYAKNDNRILVLEQKHQNLDIARKAGINLIFGEYVAFIEPNEVLNLTQFFDDYENANSKNLINNVVYDVSTKCYTLIENNENICNRLLKSSYLEKNNILFTSNETDINCNSIKNDVYIEYIKKIESSISKLKEEQKLIVQSTTKEVTDKIQMIYKEENNRLLTKLEENNKLLIESYNDNLKLKNSELNKINGQLRWARNEIDTIRTSKSHKLGLAITWLPRKIISLVRK